MTGKNRSFKMRRFVRKIAFVIIAVLLVLYLIIAYFENARAGHSTKRTKLEDHGQKSNPYVIQRATSKPSEDSIRHDDYIGTTNGTAAFTKMKFGPLFILGVFGGNTSTTRAWDIYKVYLQVNDSFYDHLSYRCCMLYRNGDATDIIERDVMNSLMYDSDNHFKTFHFVCPNPKHYSRNVPAGVAITLSKFSCKQDHVTYVKPFHPLKETETKLAISPKVAYGNINAEFIIEWMETYKYLGVDKVIAYYVDEINPKALKVLQFYASGDILDLYHFRNALQDKQYFGDTNTRIWSDKQMMVFDASAKLSGYTYFGIIDFDEFLIPSKDQTLKEMLNELFSANIDVAACMFKSQYFYTTWGPSGSVSDLKLGTYVNRTAGDPEFERRKVISKPNYIREGGISTHNVRPKRGFRLRGVDERYGFIRHYRECRRGSSKELTKCFNQTERVTDTSVAKWAKRIYKNVLRARKNIFGSETYEDD